MPSVENGTSSDMQDMENAKLGKKCKKPEVKLHDPRTYYKCTKYGQQKEKKYRHFNARRQI